MTARLQSTIAKRRRHAVLDRDRSIAASTQRRLPDLRDHPVVLAQDDVPAVVLPHVVAAVLSHGGAQPLVRQQQLQRLDELVAIRVEEAVRCCARSARRAPRCARWPGSACRRRTLRAPAATGSRTATARRRRSRPRARAGVPLGEQAGEADARLLGQLHQLHAHEHERRVAAVLHVAAEVLDQLLAALAGIDAAAVERERAVQAMPAAEHRAARPRCAAAAAWSSSLRVGPTSSVSASGTCVVVGAGVVAGMRSLRQVDAAAHGLFGERAMGKCVVRNRRSTSVL